MCHKYYIWLKDIYVRLLLLCSHSPNDVPHEPQRNVSIAAVRGAVRPSNLRPVFETAAFYMNI